MKLFTTGEVAKILNLPGERIRSFVRSGFVSPTRREKNTFQFTFQDLLFLKTAKGLLDSRVPAKRITRMLSSLKRQLPVDRPLSSLKIYADGRRVIAWDGRARWQPDSGQFLFDFDAKSIVRSLKRANPPPKNNGTKLTAEHWFNVAIELEERSRKEAERAYHMALALDPKRADAHLNLGKLHHDNKEFAPAEAHYRAALEIDPSDPAPYFNLGVLMEDLQQPQEAIRCYREAIKRNARFGDAYYNLGLVFEALGKKAEAVAHLRSARKIYLQQ
jgi:tetratricopeptide (TPR) repeat protein